MERLLTIEEVADYFNVSVSAARGYEDQGIIRRVRGIPSPRYDPKMLAQAIGVDFEALAPFRLKKLERENAELRAALARTTNQLETIEKVLKGGGV